MIRLSPVIVLCLSLWSFAPAFAASPAPAVVASIGPVHSLVAAVMAGAGQPTLLVKGAASPHTASLRPSDAAALQNADIVFWIGAEMETFLAKPLRALSARARVVALAEAPGVTLLASRQGGVWDEDHHVADRGEARHGDHGAHGDDGHRAHGASDMHIWLDPINAMGMIDAVAATLSEADPDRAATYADNAAELRQRLEMLDTDLRSRLAPYVGKPYIVFHDAYHYLEARYDLSPAGALTISPDRAPGARTLAAIRDRIKTSGVICVFREPQFEPALMTTLVAGTPARIAVLDPLGVDLAPGPEAYFTLMRRLAGSLSDCLAEG